MQPLDGGLLVFSRHLRLFLVLIDFQGLVRAFEIFKFHTFVAWSSLFFGSLHGTAVILELLEHLI